MYKKHQKYQKHWERVPLPCNNQKTKQINQRKQEKNKKINKTKTSNV